MSTFDRDPASSRCERCHCLPCICFDEDDENDMIEFVECDYNDNGDLD
jgi:hypothetical protein